MTERISQEELPVSAVTVEGNEVLVPEMLPEEVEASVASRGKKMVAIVPPAGCSPYQFKQVIAGAYALYMRHRELPTLEMMQGYLHELSPRKIKDIFHSPQFRQAMLVRGINFDATSPITPEQDMAMAIMAAPDGRPFEKKLKAAGVAPSKWRAWLKQKAFREVWDAIGGSVLKDHEGDMLVALVGEAVNGNVRAIEYAFEVSGKHNPARQQNVDATLLITQIIEILQDELKEQPQTLLRIGARMQLVGGTPAAQRVITSATEQE